MSWRLAFLVNVPIGLLVIYLARTALRETEKERMKLDATGGVLATLACTAAVFCLSTGAGEGWLSAITLGSGLVALAAFVAFALVERTAENPIVPFSLFFDRNRMATFAAMFLYRWGDFHHDRGARPVRAEHHGLRSAALSYRLHPVRLRDAHRSGSCPRGW